MMLLAMFMFMLMGICIRLASACTCSGGGSGTALLIMAPVLIRSGRDSIRMNRPKLFFGRAFINFIGMMCGFTALTLIPMAEMTALSFTGPIFVTIGAVLFLGETIRLRRSQ